MKAHKTTFTLSNVDIGKGIKEFEDILAQAGVEKRDALGLQLSLEEILLRWQEKFGEEQQIGLNAFKRLGRIFISLSLKGESCNPTESSDVAEDLVRNVMQDRGLVLNWEYRKSTNYVWIRPRKEAKKPMLKMIYGIVAALLLGMAGQMLFPEIAQKLVPFILTPLRSVLFGMLGAVAVPLIFLSVMLGVCSVGDKNSFSLIGKHVVSRFIGATALTTVVFGLLALPFFSLNMTNANVDTSQFGQIIQMLLGMLPQNLFEPFVSGNTLQLIVLAIGVGLALLLMGSRASTLINAAEQLRDIIKTLLGWISGMLPFMVFLVLLEMAWNGQMGTLLGIWKPVLLSAVISLLMIAATLLLTCRRFQLNPLRLLRLMMPTLMIGLSTSSTSMAFNTNLDCCEQDLGIDKKVSRIGVPLGTVLFSATGGVGFLLIAYYCAAQFGTECSLTWVVIAIISAFLLKTAAPPVGGGNIACYAILFTQLGIPEEALAIAVAMDIVMDRIGATAKLSLMQLDLITIADKLKMLDREKLALNAGSARKE